MLAESKIDSLDTHLEQFKLNNRTSQNDLQVCAMGPVASTRILANRI